MRDFHRERKLTWYVLLLESVIVLLALRVTYGVAPVRFFAETAAFVLAVVVTRILTALPANKCPDFWQGAVTIGCGMAMYACYSLETHSDRMLPVCMLFALMECTMYKNPKLNMFVTAMNVFACVLTLVCSELEVLTHSYSRVEFFFILLLMIISSALMLLMQVQDLFIERAAREDEKSLDDLLQLVEVKCEDATAAAKAKSSFLANMSHEIRTPINAVLGMNEMILREEQDGEIRGYAQNIQRAGTALLSLINDILDFSKIESGKMEVVPEKYRLNTLLYDILLVVRPRMEKKDLQLILDIDQNIPNELYGDEVRIRQIITNILTNAVKYTEKGSVTLRVKMEELETDKILLKVAVKDTGIGIKESKEVLFASFQRSGDLKAHHIEGTGLGLSITQELLKMMGSELMMESVYGKGSIFYFNLPQTVVGDEPMGDLNDLYKRQEEPQKKYRESFTAPKARILLVDDNAMNRTVVQSLLKQTKVQIDTAEDGRVCLKMCEKNRYDLILMDHLMPNMDGIEAFHALRADSRGPNFETPVIILTANAVAGMKQGYLDEGFTSFLSKPVQGELLEKALIEYLPSSLVKLSEELELDTSAEEERQASVRKIIDRLQLPDLDLDDALEYSSGKVADVLETIHGYVLEMGMNRENISREYKAENWSNFKIHVHALKSTSRVVGAIHMAFLAEQMEKAADTEDTAYINEHYEMLIREYEELCVDFRHLLSETLIRKIATINMEEECEKEAYLADMQMFLKGAKEYDVDFAKMQELCERHPMGMLLTGEREELKHAVEDFDYEAIAEILGRMIALLTKD